MRFVDQKRRICRTDYKLLEARSDAGGNYRLEIPGIAEPTTISIDAMKPGYRRSVGMLMIIRRPEKRRRRAGRDGGSLPDLKPALYFAGTVVNEQGKPIPGVEISANAALGNGSGGVERTTGRPDGTFELFNYPLKTEDFGKMIGKGSSVSSIRIISMIKSMIFTHLKPNDAAPCGSSLRRVTG